MLFLPLYKLWKLHVDNCIITYGVFYFFRYIALKYGDKCLYKLNGTYEDCETVKSLGLSIDYLHYDLNAIFHPICQEAYEYGAFKKNTRPSLLHPNRPKPKAKQIDDIIVYDRICKRIEDLRRIHNPSKGLMLAVDGVAGCSKMAQQRKRRFKSALESQTEDESAFDPNSLSSGTVYMENLNIHIDNFIQSQLEENKWNGLSVLFSSHRVPGEGEHKCIEMIRENRKNTHCVISPDADLIMLTAAIHGAKCYIFRENIFEDIDGSFFLVDVDKFKECIINELEIKNNTETAITDFIVFCFMLGNDFLANIPSLYINNDAIGTLINIYKKVTVNGPLVNSNHVFNKDVLKLFLTEMAKIENNMILSNKTPRYPDPILQKYSPDIDTYKREYYKIKFPGIDIQEIVIEYLKGMTFVTKYYLDGIPSWTWQMPFHYSPFFSELAAFVDKFDVNVTFDQSEPFSPLEQLLAILPPKSAKLLPEPLRWLSTREDSPIISYYPHKFEIDYDGKNNDYEGVPIIPHINVLELRKAFNKALLSKKDKRRNSPDDMVKYVI